MTAKKKSKPGFLPGFLKILRILIYISGFLFLVAAITAFTTLPFYAWHRLATVNSKIMETPRNIVLLGGSGMPGQDGLLKSYYTAVLAKKYPDAKVVILIPCDTTEPNNPAGMLREELMLRGVPAGNITLMPEGSNTRQQALKLHESNLVNPSLSLVIVAAPEHMYRSVKTFRKAGFEEVGGFPTFENSLLVKDIQFNDKMPGENPLVPPIGNNLQIRYQFWNHLKLEILVVREWIAIAYYKLRGWI